MKLLLLAFASLGFLVTPASGGGTRCGRKVAGHCRLQCLPSERSAFLCGRYKLCCVVNDLVPEPIKPPPIKRHPCRQTTKSKKQQPGMSIRSKPLPSPMTQRTTHHQITHQ